MGSRDFYLVRSCVTLLGMPKIKHERAIVEPPASGSRGWFDDGLPGRPQMHWRVGVGADGEVRFRPGKCAVCLRACHTTEASEWWGWIPVCNSCVTDFYWWSERKMKARGVQAVQRRDTRLGGLPQMLYRRSDVYRRDRGVCHLCGFHVNGTWSLDHLVPISWVGDRVNPGDVINNAAVTHPGCNSRKGNRWADWAKYEALVDDPGAACPVGWTGLDTRC